MSIDAIVIFCTFPASINHKDFVDSLIEEKLAACVNATNNINSTFMWEGSLDSSQEILLIIKTKKSLFPAISSRIKEMHPYDCPEIIALPILHIDKDYYDWLNKNTI